jgi:hypothetical protein
VERQQVTGNVVTNSGRRQTNIRLSDKGRALLEELQVHFGLSQTGVIEFLLREKARAVAAEPKPVPRPFSLAAIPVTDEDDEPDARPKSGWTKLDRRA